MSSSARSTSSASAVRCAGRSPADTSRSLILWGPPGTGKTTLARLLADAIGAEMTALSAVSSGVAEVRAAIAQAQERLALNGQRTVLFIDEIHRFNKAQQDALLPYVEDGTITLTGTTTENPYFEVNSALLSRMRVWRLEALTDEEVATVVRRALDDDGARPRRRARARRRRRPRPRTRSITWSPSRAATRGRRSTSSRAPSALPKRRTSATPRAASARGSRTSRRPPSSGSSPTTGPATATTTRSRRSSRASAATIPTARSTGSLR